MYELEINGKQVSIEITKESGVTVFESQCDGQSFHSAIAKRDGEYFLLLKKPVVGVGMYSEDQETLKAMHEEFKEVESGIRS